MYHQKSVVHTKSQPALPSLSHMPYDFVFPDYWEPFPVFSEALYKLVAAGSAILYSSLVLYKLRKINIKWLGHRKHVIIV